jgi:hypothetical protein
MQHKYLVLLLGKSESENLSQNNKILVTYILKNNIYLGFAHFLLKKHGSDVCSPVGTIYRVANG